MTLEIQSNSVKPMQYFFAIHRPDNYSIEFIHSIWTNLESEINNGATALFFF